jgi:hypothetical protein
MDPMARALHLMFTRCTDPAREDEFNRWYTHTHLPDLSVARGMVGARRYVNANPDPAQARYLAVYEFETDDIHAALAEMTELALQAFDRGRHIDCIEGAPAGNSTMGCQWREIEPTSLRPLEKLDYPGAPPAVREAMLALIASLRARR